MPVIPILSTTTKQEPVLALAPLSQYCSAYVDSITDFIHIIEQQLRNAEDHKIDVILNLHFNRTDRIKTIVDASYAEQTQATILEKVMLCLREKDQFIFVSHQECWIFLPQLSSDALAILAVHRLLAVFNLPIKVDLKNRVAENVGEQKSEALSEKLSETLNAASASASASASPTSLSHSSTIFLHPSIGVACSPAYHFDAYELIDIADKAQKNAVLNHLQFSIGQVPIDLCIASAEKLKLLQNELDENSLEIKYQPKVDFVSSKKISVEALVRWPSAHQHVIATHHLISLSEEFGLIDQLTMQVVNKVFKDVHEWKKQEIEIVVWINLSALLLSSEHLPQLLTRALQIWQISAASIGFEITESALIQNIEQTTELLFQLKNAGFQLAIDDFGTGYSSFSYLRRFPINEIKIDKTFIQDMLTSVQDRQIVQSIIDLGHNFGLKVVAEGIEDEATLTMLKSMHCDAIQGFYLAHPMQYEQIIAWYSKENNQNQA